MNRSGRHARIDADELENKMSSACGLFIRIDQYVISSCISVVLFAAVTLGDGHPKYLTLLEFYHISGFKAGTTGILERFLPARHGTTDSESKTKDFRHVSFMTVIFCPRQLEIARSLASLSDIPSFLHSE